MTRRLILAALTHLAHALGFHGIDDTTHALLLATIDEDAKNYAAR